MRTGRGTSREFDLVTLEKYRAMDSYERRVHLALLTMPPPKVEPASPPERPGIVVIRDGKVQH